MGSKPAAARATQTRPTPARLKLACLAEGLERTVAGLSTQPGVGQGIIIGATLGDADSLEKKVRGGGERTMLASKWMERAVYYHPQVNSEYCNESHNGALMVPQWLQEADMSTIWSHVLVASRTKKIKE